MYCNQLLQQGGRQKAYRIRFGTYMTIGHKVVLKARLQAQSLIVGKMPRQHSQAAGCYSVSSAQIDMRHNHGLAKLHFKHANTIITFFGLAGQRKLRQVAGKAMAQTGARYLLAAPPRGFSSSQSKASS